MHKQECTRLEQFQKHEMLIIVHPSLRLAAFEWSLVLLVDFFAAAHDSQMRLTSSSSSGSPQMRCSRPPHGPQQENSGVVVLSPSWHNSPAEHGMVHAGIPGKTPARSQEEQMYLHRLRYGVSVILLLSW